MPLVYCSKRAAEQAGRLLPRGTVLENAVAEAIMDGHVRGPYVLLKGGALLARVERQEGRLRPRPRSWLVIDVQPNGGRGGR